MAELSTDIRRTVSGERPDAWSKLADDHLGRGDAPPDARWPGAFTQMENGNPTRA
jgi:hypothetical protein